MMVRSRFNDSSGIADEKTNFRRNARHFFKRVRWICRDAVTCRWTLSAAWSSPRAICRGWANIRPKADKGEVGGVVLRSLSQTPSRWH